MGTLVCVCVREREKRDEERDVKQAIGGKALLLCVGLMGN